MRLARTIALLSIGLFGAGLAGWQVVRPPDRFYPPNQKSPLVVIDPKDNEIPHQGKNIIISPKPLDHRKILEQAEKRGIGIGFGPLGNEKQKEQPER